MRRPLLAVCILLFSAGVCACAGSEGGEEKEEAPGTSALREYVNTPKDKARAAGRAVRRQQRATDEQASQLVDE